MASHIGWMPTAPMTPSPFAWEKAETSGKTLVSVGFASTRSKSCHGMLALARLAVTPSSSPDLTIPGSVTTSGRFIPRLFATSASGSLELAPKTILVGNDHVESIQSLSVGGPSVLGRKSTPSLVSYCFSLSARSPWSTRRSQANGRRLFSDSWHPLGFAEVCCESAD